MARITSEQRQVVVGTQDKVLAAVKPAGPAAQPWNRSEATIVSMRKCPGDKLGPAAKSIHRFADLVAPGHPDLAALEALPGWEGFATDLDQAANGTIVDAGLSDRLVKDYQPIVRTLAAVKPRLIADPLKRSDSREMKRAVKNVSMKSVYVQGENGFYGRPNNFDMYVRGSRDHLAEIGRLKARQDVFVRNGMNEVAHAVQKRIAALEEFAADCHLGFHRMRPEDAAVVSARMHGLKWHEVNFLTVPFAFFETAYWAEVVEKNEANRDKDELKKLLVMKDRQIPFVDSVAFTYQPRLYPLAKFGNMPKAVADVITNVESMPEVNGCPVFDYYWVLVPSINVNHPFFRHKDGWRVRTRRQEGAGWTDLELKTYSDEYDAAMALDQTLVCDGYFVPVVLGEREGKCHFLTLWK